MPRHVLLVSLLVAGAGACTTSASAPAEVVASQPGGLPTTAGTAPTTATTTAPAPTTAPTSTTTALPPTTTTVPLDSAQRRLELVRTITGDITPKSVAASGTGLVSAQNMMYRHTVTLYDAAGELRATIPDTVDLGSFGFAERAGRSRGAPVEAAWAPDASRVYVSNYSMEGPGAGRYGDDRCSPASGVADSFVYRIDPATAAIDGVIPVGAVPKFLAVTPDGGTLLVSNWCSYDLSVVDLATGRERARVRTGAYPRGIAVSPDGRTAYVAAMGTTRVQVLDVASATFTGELTVGRGPRHVVVSPDGAFLYVTLNAEGRVAKVDLATGAVVAKVATGAAPRSMAIAPDGQMLYVVNYRSNTVSAVRTADLAVVQEVPTRPDPIGITYEPTTDTVWVACYKGAIQLFRLA